MRPFTLLIKPSGPDCNLACGYCFYTPKTCLFGRGRHRMSDEMLERMIGDYLKLQFPSSAFAWQGGEPTLMGLDFYKRVVELQQRYGKGGQLVSNALQTNGILLDEQWCRFLNEYKFLVGISLDGPKKYHDHYRLDHTGGGTFDKVMAAVENCRKYNVQFNILVLLTNINVQAQDELFDFFREHRIKYLQFVPCVERDAATGEIAPFSITAKQYGEFLCRIFDRWAGFGPGQISIRIFDSVLLSCLGRPQSVCTFGRSCNDYVVVEHNGDVFSCDFFVEDEGRLGNILQTPIEELASGQQKRGFARKKTDISNDCLVCRHLPMCRGGCLKDRRIVDGRYNAASYFCEGYKRFFDYTLDRFWEMTAALRPTEGDKN